MRSGNFFRVNLQLIKLKLPLGPAYLHLNLYFHSSHHLYYPPDKSLSSRLRENWLDTYAYHCGAVEVG